jgi:hypothetical protein
MVTTLVFSIDKKAKTYGGDKYVCSIDPKFQIYIPQSISRQENGECHNTLEISIKKSNAK